MDRSSLPIFFSVSFPAVNGITTYSINLARALGRLGYPTRLLLTEADTLLATYRERPLEIPADVAVERLPVSRIDGWGAHWGALVSLLEERAPCVYVPNSDYRHSVVSPVLGQKVIVLGVAHADEPLHYDHVARLGRHWNAIACVSEAVAARLREDQPELAPRLRVIRNGVDTPPAYPEGRRFEGPLRLVYHGAFKQQQKRVLDFPLLLRSVRAHGVDAHLTLIGSGPDEQALRESARELVAAEVLAIEPPQPNDALRERLRNFHVYVLNSEFEGMPQALLEAMSQGCVPVVSDVSSGTREVVRDGENGYLVGVGDYRAFAERLAVLQADRARLERMSRSAFETVGARGLRLEDTARKYDALILELAEQATGGGFVRVPGPIAAPPVVVGGLSVFPTPLPARHARYGAFPSWSDVSDFEWEILRKRCRREAQPVLLALRELGGGYQSELALDLARGLREEGYDARLVCLRESARVDDSPLEIACTRRDVGWAGAAARMLRLVESHAPCMYLALDRDTACLAPRLPSSVRNFVMASLNDVDWLLASRLLHHVDGVVFSSPEAEARALPGGPPGEARVAVIPFPIDSLSAAPERDSSELTVLVYAGHLDGLAPEPGTLRALVQALCCGERPVRAELAVPRGRAPAIRSAISDLRTDLEPRVVEVADRPGLRPLLDRAHMLVPAVALDDISLVVLDALGHACIPVCRRTRALEHTLEGELGAGLVDEADPRALAARVRELGASRERLSALGERARLLIASCYPGVRDVVDRWMRLLVTVWAAERQGERRVGPIFPPYPDLSNPAELERKLVRFAGVGAFNHWHEWVEFRTRAGIPHRVARALLRWARGKRASAAPRVAE